MRREERKSTFQRACGHNTVRHTARHTDRQTDRQTDRRTHHKDILGLTLNCTVCPQNPHRSISLTCCGLSFTINWDLIRWKHSVLIRLTVMDLMWKIICHPSLPSPSRFSAEVLIFQHTRLTARLDYPRWPLLRTLS